MRLSIILHIICFGLILSDFGLGTATQFSKSQVYLLPWEMIVEKFCDNNHLHGRVWNILTDPYVVIWGSDGTNKGFADINKETARLLANGGLCFSTAKMPQELIKSHNIVLVGPEESNLQLSRVRKHLPVRIEKDLILANDRSYSGDTGFILIYPNPNNPKKYLAVFSGTTLKAMQYIFKAYSEMRSVRPADVGIYEITNTGSIKWHVTEKFNTAWSWHKDWDQILFNIDSKKSRWKWHQWIAKTVRDQLQADVVFCEEPFIFKSQLHIGQVTYRDLFNTFKNAWYIKVKIHGKSLRVFLTVPFTNISTRDVDAPIIDGVSLLQEVSGIEKKVLTINEIEDDVIYTAAMPEKCLNGQRLGVVPENYDIINQVYLIPILKQYIKSNSEISIDDQLDSLVLKLY